jgi:hypothetical protein
METTMRLILVSILALLFAAAASAKDVVTVAELTPFAEDSGVTENVKRECGMEKRLPEYLKSNAKKHTKIVFTSEPLDSVEGKVLFMEITNVFAPGGGAYSGSKSVIVAGELKEGGELIGSMTVRRHSLVGMMPGTCSIMKRIVKKLGEDIATWLAAPTMDAELGDLEDDDDESGEAQEE